MNQFRWSLQWLFFQSNAHVIAWWISTQYKIGWGSKFTQLCIFLHIDSDFSIGCGFAPFSALVHYLTPFCALVHYLTLFCIILCLLRHSTRLCAIFHNSTLFYALVHPIPYGLIFNVWKYKNEFFQTNLNLMKQKPFFPTELNFSHFVRVEKNQNLSIDSIILSVRPIFKRKIVSPVKRICGIFHVFVNFLFHFIYKFWLLSSLIYMYIYLFK